MTGVQKKTCKSVHKLISYAQKSVHQVNKNELHKMCTRIKYYVTKSSQQENKKTTTSKEYD